MKRKIVAILLTSVLALSGCGNSDQTSTNAKTSIESEDANQNEQSLEDSKDAENESPEAVNEPENTVTTEP